MSKADTVYVVVSNIQTVLGEKPLTCGLPGSVVTMIVSGLMHSNPSRSTHDTITVSIPGSVKQMFRVSYEVVSFLVFLPFTFYIYLSIATALSPGFAYTFIGNIVFTNIAVSRADGLK